MFIKINENNKCTNIIIFIIIQLLLSSVLLIL